MITLSHKSKQYLTVALKVLVLVITFGYIYKKLAGSDVLSFSELIAVAGTQKQPFYVVLPLFIALAAANWYFEIVKWKTAASVLAPVSFATALRQSLASLTVSLATPNRIGEYGAKALFFPSFQRKKVLLLTFFCNSMQLLTTLIFGIIGLVWVFFHFNISISLWHLLVLLLGLLLFIFFAVTWRNKEGFIKGFTLVKVWRYLTKLPFKVQLKVLVFSVMRYLIFSLLFYLLLQFFGSTIGISEAAFLIFTMYLLVSILPAFFIFDVVIRGGVAVWLFSMVQVPQLVVVCTVLSMWLLNFVFPALWGSLYVATFKTQPQWS